MIAFDSCVSGVNEKQAAMLDLIGPHLGAINAQYRCDSPPISSVSQSLIFWTSPNVTKCIVLSDDRLSICIRRSTSCYIREMVYQVCSVLINALICPLKCRNLWYCNVWTQLYWSALKEGGKNEGIKERKREVLSAMVASRVHTTEA